MTRHSPQAMRHCLMLAALVAAWMVGSSAPVRGQNPITAAKEAFKKAREDAKRPAAPAQPVEPAQPAQSAQRPAAAAGASMADCCSPEAIGKLASTVGYVDIVGVKLGMTMEQAIAALKANNPKLVIDVHDAEITAGAKQGRRPRVILAHLPAAGRNPDLWGNLDGSHEAIGVQLTAPPGPLVVEMVIRYVGFASNAPLAPPNIIEGLRKKYGTEPWNNPGAQRMGWIFDPAGKPLTPNPQQQYCIESPQIALIGGDIRGIDSATAAGRVFGSVNDHATSGSSIELHTKCAPYLVVRADIDPGRQPNTAQGFWTMIHSWALVHNSLTLTAAYIRGEAESQIKQQEDAASKRAVPKL